MFKDQLNTYRQKGPPNEADNRRLADSFGDGDWHGRGNGDGALPMMSPRYGLCNVLCAADGSLRAIVVNQLVRMAP